MKFTQQWEGRNCASDQNPWFPATVPGNIQKDYAVFAGFEDWQYADNYKQFLPFENDAWMYRTALQYDKKEGERVFFVSEGINYRYDIALNGETVYSCEGMFRRAEIDLTDRLTGANDVLTVMIHPHPKRPDALPDCRDEADASCNPPVYYGWDWNPRLLISGIWDETYIETRTDAYIGQTEVRCTLDESLTLGTVTAAFDCALPCEIILLDAEGHEVYRGTERTFTVSNPHLWWCSGQGEAYLYTWVIRNEREERTGHIGFRRVTLERNTEGPFTFPKGRYEAPITIQLNGRCIFAKGSNWVNPELFWGEITKERYEELICLAKDCHMNIFRMWGGAGVPKESFYDICDREGIMIWQEFMLACNNYLARPHYMQVLESEATAIIRKFRHHPALVFWCGGNELFNDWSGMTEQSHALRLLNKICYDLDYERPFLYTSPLFGMSHGGYTFYSPDQGGDVFQEFQNASATAYTEFGVPGIASVEVLREIIPADELFPIEKTDAWVAHHGFGAWGESRWVCKDVHDRYFAPASSLEEFVSHQQWMQCEGYRGAFEEMRRQWPRCSMAINWDFNEPWKTVAGNNLIAYPTRIRPAYWYVQKALRPTHFSAKIARFDWREGETFEAELWLLNDAPEAASGTVHVTAKVGEHDFELIDWHTETGANANRRGPTVRFTLPHADTDRVVLTLAAENGMESEYEFRYIAKEEIQRIGPRQLNT